MKYVCLPHSIVARVASVFILVLPIILLCGSSFASSPIPQKCPMHHGVVFYCPPTSEEALKQMKLIKKDGFDLIEFSSWIWTIPSPGSDMERNVKNVLDWCDGNDVAFVLLHNIQFLSEGGGLNEGVIHPDNSLKYVTDWARVLQGHKSVMGVILGNEVGPDIGSPKDAPVLWNDFRVWLKNRHKSIKNLNNTWKTTYSSFDDIDIPANDAPGIVDVRRYAQLRFADFYAVFFDKAFRPVLGEKLYGQKTSLDPFVHRACNRNTMVCWDDVVADFPLWEIKCAADTSPKPLFNSELHLYNDGFEYAPSVEASRYRYFTSALIGEYMTASFAWGQWQKPEIARIHSATPAILVDLKRVENYCKEISKTYRDSELAVLVTEENYYRMAASPEEQMHMPLPILYARMSALGRPWRYILEDDLPRFKRGTIVIWTIGLKQTSAEALVNMPKTVELVAIGNTPQSDEYSNPLPGTLRSSLEKRCKVIKHIEQSSALLSQKGLPAQYQQTEDVGYFVWSPERGHITCAVPNAALEVKWARTGNGLVLAVINNTRKAKTAPIPWSSGQRRVVDLLTGKILTVSEKNSTQFGPLGVRMFLIK